jgi:hypothetical protein
VTRRGRAGLIASQLPGHRRPARRPGHDRLPRQRPRRRVARVVTADPRMGARTGARPARRGFLILVLLWEPLAGATLHTLPGTPRHLPAEFRQLRRPGRFRELARFRPGFRLTSEGSLVRSQLRPRRSTRSEHMSIFIEISPEPVAGATRAKREPGRDRAWKGRSAASSSLTKMPGCRERLPSASHYGRTRSPSLTVTSLWGSRPYARRITPITRDWI